MSSMFDVQPPEWLQRIAQPADTSKSAAAIGALLAGATNALKRDPNAPADASWLSSRTGFAQGLFEARMNQIDPLWPIKVQQAKSLILERQAQMTAAYAKLAVTNQQQAGMITDAALFSDFMQQTGGDPVKILNTPMPNFSLTASAHRFLDMQKAAGQSAAVLQAKALNTDIDKSLLAISYPDLKASALKVIGLTDLEEKRQQAALLLQVAAGRQEFERTKAETEATIRGDVPTTRITDKGVATTFAPAKVGDVNAEPNMKVLPSGETLVWMPGAKGVHVIKNGKEIQVSPSVALEIAKEAKAQRISGADEILGALVQQAREQAKLPPKKQGIPPIEQEPWYPMVKPVTVRVKSPDGRTGTIPASQLDEAKKAGYTVLAQ